MNTQRIPTHERGFVLLEALITLVLITFGFLGILKLQSTLVVASSEGRARATAQALAEQKIEQLRAYMVLTADHTSGTSPCAAPTAWSGSESNLDVGGVRFNRVWGVDASKCSEYRNIVVVNVFWSDKQGQQNVHLSSQIAWVDPGKTQLLAATISPPTLYQPPASAVRVTNTYSTDGSGVPIVPGGTLQSDGNGDGVPDDHRDRSYVFFKDGMYELVVVDSAGNATGVLQSTLPFINMKGRVLVHDQTGAALSTLCNTALPIPSDVGYCVFPLYHADVSGHLAGTPIDACSGGTPPTIKVAAYSCFVGQGWYGNLQLLNSSAQSYFDGTNGVDRDRACPEFPLRGEQDPGAWAPGSRLVYVSILDGNQIEIGRSGMLPAYQSALSNLDYIIYGDNRFGSGQDARTVVRCVPNSGYTNGVANPAYDSTTDYGLLDTDAMPNGTVLDLQNYTYGGTTGVQLDLDPADFKPYEYAAAYIHTSGTYSTAQDLNLTGTITLQGVVATNPARVTVTASSSATCATPYVSGGMLTYACKVATGASGTLALNADANDVICDSVGVASLSYTMTADTVYDLFIKPNGSGCP